MIKTIKPLKTSQSLREEAAQPTLQNPAPTSGWKQRGKSTWATPAPEPVPKTAKPAPAPAASPIAVPAPTTPDSAAQYMTGSTLAVVKLPLPKGVYVIVGLSTVDLVLSLFRGSDTNVLFTIVLFLDLLACVGLLLKREFVRKVLIIVATITVILAGLEARGLMLEKKENHTTTIAYVGLGIGVATSIGQIAYLTRPKVRGVFEELKT